MAFYRPQSVKDYVELTRRLFQRKWLILGVFVALTAITTVVVMRMPRLYKSNAMILIQPGEISMASVNLSVNVEQRLRNLRPLITSRTTLEKIIEELDLYPDLRQSQPLDYIVEHMRRFIEVEVQGRDLFRVSYVHMNPKVAQLVTDRLSRQLMLESVNEDTKRAREKVDFLTKSVEDLRRQLKDRDEKVRQFTSENSETLITRTEGGLSPIAGLSEQLKLVDSNLRSAQDRRALLEKQRGNTGDVVRERPAPADPELVAAQQAVSAARVNLEKLLAKYTEAHPDVIRAKEELRDADTQLRKAQAKAGPAVVPQGPRPNPQLANIGRELDVVDAEIKRLKAERESMAKELTDMRGSVKQAPLVFAQLDELERERKRIADQLDVETTKLNDAVQEEKIVSSNKGDVFKLQDPANLPEQPDSPKRTLFVAAGAVLGLFAGLGVALVLVYFDQTVYNDYELSRVTDLPVLVSVARYEMPAPGHGDPR